MCSNKLTYPVIVMLTAAPEAKIPVVGPKRRENDKQYNISLTNHKTKQ